MSNKSQSRRPEEPSLNPAQLREAVLNERAWLEENNAISAVTEGPVEDQEGIPLPADMHQGTPPAHSDRTRDENQLPPEPLVDLPEHVSKPIQTDTPAHSAELNEGDEMKLALKENNNFLESLPKDVIAGTVASAAMMGVAYALRAAHVNAPDFASQYGAIINEGKHPKPASGKWWIGMAWHTINGSLLFSALYGRLRRKKATPALVEGVIYGSLLSLVAGTLVAPLAGEGVFFKKMRKPLVTTFAAGACWLVYGVVLGSSRKKVGELSALRGSEKSKTKAA